jgi:hypothetical protein
MFKHFLITRFNLRKSDWTTNKKNRPILTDKWHENRFDLFINYCFQSVGSQTNKNFEWLVFFDTTTPKKYRDIIESLKLQLTNFRPIFIDGMEMYLPTIKDYISNCNYEYIITSRLDNDDCIGISYIEEIQKRFNNQTFTAIDFIDGYTIQIHPTIKIGKRFDQYNPFISLIEKNTNPKTVWSIRHSHWKREKNVIQVRNIRIWASIIHQENKVNEFYGYGHINVLDLFNNISIHPNKIDYINTHLIHYKKWRFQSISNLISSYWNFGFKKLKKKLGVYKFK